MYILLRVNAVTFFTFLILFFRNGRLSKRSVAAATGGLFVYDFIKLQRHGLYGFKMLGILFL